MIESKHLASLVHSNFMHKTEQAVLAEYLLAKQFNICRERPWEDPMWKAPYGAACKVFGFILKQRRLTFDQIKKQIDTMKFDKIEDGYFLRKQGTPSQKAMYKVKEVQRYMEIKAKHEGVWADNPIELATVEEEYTVAKTPKRKGGNIL